MMARYFPLIEQLGADVLVDARPEVLSLLTHNFPNCKFIATEIQTPISESFDYWTGIMSLPFHFQSSVNNVPFVQGYISAPEEQSRYWSERLSLEQHGSKLNVGLAWSGNPAHRADKRRSMSFETVCKLLRRFPDVRFFSLQTQVPSVCPSSLIVSVVRPSTRMTSR